MSEKPYRAMSEKEARQEIEKIHKKSEYGKLAISYVRSRFDTDYMSDITELWLIESYLAGYKLAQSNTLITKL